MTKMMDNTAIQKFFTNNTWSIAQAEESKLKKFSKQLARRKNRENRTQTVGEQTVVADTEPTTPREEHLS